MDALHYEDEPEIQNVDVRDGYLNADHDEAAELERIAAKWEDKIENGYLKNTPSHRYTQGELAEEVFWKTLNYIVKSKELDHQNCMARELRRLFQEKVSVANQQLAHKYADWVYELMRTCPDIHAHLIYNPVTKNFIPRLESRAIKVALCFFRSSFQWSDDRIAPIRAFEVIVSFLLETDQWFGTMMEDSYRTRQPIPVPMLYSGNVTTSVTKPGIYGSLFHRPNQSPIIYWEVSLRATIDDQNPAATSSAPRKRRRKSTSVQQSPFAEDGKKNKVNQMLVSLQSNPEVTKTSFKFDNLNSFLEGVPGDVHDAVYHAVKFLMIVLTRSTDGCRGANYDLIGCGDPWATFPGDPKERKLLVRKIWSHAIMINRTQNFTFPVMRATGYEAQDDAIMRVYLDKFSDLFSPAQHSRWRIQFNQAFMIGRILLEVYDLVIRQNVLQDFERPSGRKRLLG